MNTFGPANIERNSSMSVSLRHSLPIPFFVVFACYAIPYLFKLFGATVNDQMVLDTQCGIFSAMFMVYGIFSALKFKATNENHFNYKSTFSKYFNTALFVVISLGFAIGTEVVTYGTAKESHMFKIKTYEAQVAE